MIYLSYPFYTEHIVDWKKETIVAYICYIIILKEDRNLFFFFLQLGCMKCIFYFQSNIFLQCKKTAII